MTVLALFNVINSNVYQIKTKTLAELVPRLVNLLSSNELDLETENPEKFRIIFSYPISEQMLIKNNLLTIHDTEFAETLIKCIRCILRRAELIGELELIQVFIMLLDCLHSRLVDGVEAKQLERGEARIRLVLLEEMPTVLKVAEIGDFDATSIYSELRYELHHTVQVANMDAVDQLVRQRVADILVGNLEQMKLQNKGECEISVENLSQVSISYRIIYSSNCNHTLTFDIKIIIQFELSEAFLW